MEFHITTAIEADLAEARQMLRGKFLSPQLGDEGRRGDQTAVRALCCCGFVGVERVGFPQGRGEV